MSPLRRTALASVVAAICLIAIKLVTGLAAGSLGLVADAAHSGTDLVAALLTFYDVDPSQVRFLGTMRWQDDLRVLDESALHGGWFAALPPETMRLGLKTPFRP